MIATHLIESKPTHRKVRDVWGTRLGSSLAPHLGVGTALPLGSRLEGSW
ncbi:hypothetical protein SBA7_320062 [Candidatus Sulfotelmatobacter sp. SbA7]|nr:hypothetical protein SBA7_320062 [Candidatus Sulfotelmatobacter sp. SbA7]